MVIRYGPSSFLDVLEPNMDKQTILKKAIEKAVKNGLDLRIWLEPNETEEDIPELIDSYSKFYYEDKKCYPFIFSHDFAKAFWKTKRCKTCAKEKIPLKNDCKAQEWKYNLCQMVLEKDPIKYLEKFL